MSVGLRRLGIKEAARYLHREKEIPANYSYLWRLIVVRALVLVGVSYFIFFPHSLINQELILATSPLWAWLVLQINYFLRIFSSRRSPLTLSFSSVTDRGSYWRVGFLHRDVIKKISIESSLLSTYLCIQLKPNFHPPLSWGRSWLFEVYEGLFGNQLVMPLGFLQIPEKVLREQLNYYFGDSPEILGKSGAAQMRIEKLIEYDKKHGLQATEEKMELASVEGAEAVTPKKHPVVEKVEKIKTEIRQNGFDKLVLELYYDYVRHFTRWQEQKDQRLSPGVRHIGKSSDGQNLETISFTYDKNRLKFSMNMIQASSNLAKLSVWVKGQPRFVMAVRVEIAALEALDIERYIGGSWVDGLKKLHNDLYERDTGRQLKAFQPSESSVVESVEFNVETLKEQFGIKE